MLVDASAVIASLDLQPHLEGGYFRRSHTSPLTVDTDTGPRAMLSSIFYLLSSASPIGYLHRNRADILHFWQGGDALRYTLLQESGELRQTILGPDLAAGQCLQLLVPGGCWKASELLAGDYGLISEAVCPGFDYRDHDMARAADLKDRFPQHWPALAHLIKPMASEAPADG